MDSLLCCRGLRAEAVSRIRVSFPLRVRGLGEQGAERCRVGLSRHLPRRPVLCLSKQRFVEPLWLLSSNGDDVGFRDRADGFQPVQDAPEAEALYLVQLITSKDNGSGLSEPDAGVIISLIGENGKALLRRVPCPSAGKDSGCFQTGSQDVIKLHGADLGRLSAIWIAPEAGTWRMARAVVAVIPYDQSNAQTIHRLGFPLAVSSLSDGETLTGVVHLFEENRDGDTTAVELAPYSVRGFEDGLGLKALWPHSEESAQVQEFSVAAREAGMEEYRALKTSLLGTSALLVALGTVSLVSVESMPVAESFAIGGAGAIIHLLLLQKVVDHMAASSDSATSKTSLLVTNVLSSPLTRLTLVAMVTLILARMVWSPGDAVTLQYSLVAAGVAGFVLTSRISIFLAATKPSPRGDARGQ